MTNPRIPMISLALACTLAAAACSKSESAGAPAAKASSFTPTEFTGKIIDFRCLPSTCDHAHYSVGDAIWVKPKTGNKYHFKSTKLNGKVNEAELTYSNGILRGTTDFDHHGSRQTHWLILVPYEKEPWAIATCDKDPGEAETCEGDQHAGYGHADD